MALGMYTESGIRGRLGGEGKKPSTTTYKWICMIYGVTDSWQRSGSLW